MDKFIVKRKRQDSESEQSAPSATVSPGPSNSIYRPKEDKRKKRSYLDSCLAYGGKPYACVFSLWRNTQQRGHGDKDLGKLKDRICDNLSRLQDVFVRDRAYLLVFRTEPIRVLPLRWWKDNIKLDLREVGYADREWINLPQDRGQWRPYVRAAMNL
ncbi:hypothetical protein ANN_02153 [Periplaneta americana]|uniref:Uncharacterized protein n=1 Tax=Periplaneta americana TaxID=6978 RepID=A0ABQ8TXZ7_PERAM|nr:hypothetical protein ANN_02153 [Periplaneta americana]